MEGMSAVPSMKAMLETTDNAGNAADPGNAGSASDATNAGCSPANDGNSV